MTETTQHTRHSRSVITANADLKTGSALMALAGVAFIGYGLVFLVWNFAGGAFELGVETINGTTRADLNAFEPAVLHYISHLHVATAAFIVSTGIAVAGLAWYGIRQGQVWAWTTAVMAAVLGLAIALPMHWVDLFTHDWLTHLGPVYLAAGVFVAGALLALRGLGRAGRST
ncbi:MAG: hypothetical protein M3O70_06210 [Actinomycetota bacterium]|nr:hypothetical protein [Actinomycetota bacterium]